MKDQPSERLSLALPASWLASRSPRQSALQEEVATLFDQLRDRLLRYLISIGLPPQDGEEVIQETFLALFVHLQKGRSRSHLRGWVFRVAHNLGLKRRTPAASALPRETQDLLDPAPNAEQSIAASQEQRRVMAVLRALPEQDRRCLALRAEGLTYREIADVLGISLGMVSVLLSRALGRLSRAKER